MRGLGDPKPLFLCDLSPHCQAPLLQSLASFLSRCTPTLHTLMHTCTHPPTPPLTPEGSRPLRAQMWLSEAAGSSCLPGGAD
jgi:hypothetical protein